MTPSPTDMDYRHLLELRTGLRRFLRWSEHQAQQAGVTPAQHQLLLAVRGHTDPQGPTVGDVADYLVLRHHSAVGLVDRAAAAGLIKRARDRKNSSAVRLRLTEKGSRTLDALSEQHLKEIAHLAPTMHGLWEGFEQAATHETAPP
jgi:DNA-binding MarR family transcriptional regulator